MKLLFRGTSFRFVYLILQFLTGVLISYFSGKELFGTISICIANTALLVLLSGLGQDASLLWHRSADKLKDSQALGYSIFIFVQQLLIYGLVTGLCLYVSGHLFLSGRGISFMPFELAYFSGVLIWEKYGNLFYASGLALTANWNMAVTAMISFLSIAILFYSGICMPEQAFSLFCLMTLLQGVSLLLSYHVKKKCFIPQAVSLGTVRSLFSFSVIVFATNLIQFLAYRLDYWLLLHFRDLSQVGLYAQAGRFAQFVWVIPGILAAMIYQPLASGNPTFGVGEVKRILRLMNMANLIVILVLCVFTYITFHFFLLDYREAFDVFLIFLPGMYLFCQTLILASFFSAGRMLMVNLIISAGCLLMIAIADIVLIPAYGIRGAAWANTLAYSLSGIASLFVFSTKRSISFFELLWPRKEDIIFIKNEWLR